MMNSFLGSLTKYGLIFFNFVCLVFGLLFIIFGALARGSSKYEAVINIGQGPANMSIAIGVIVFVICFLGCCGAIKENRCMLITFGSVILILVVVEFAVGALAYKNRDQLENLSESGFNKTLEEYYQPGKESLRKNIDDLQINLKCCGASGPQDWLILKEKKIPASCCTDAKGDSCDIHSPTTYSQGCVHAIKETLAPAMKVLAITVIVFAVIQLLGIIGSCCIASCIKRASYNSV